MAKIKSVNQFEQEFMEHIDVLRHAHGEGDNELETVYMKALADMRRDIKEKELNALLSGDRDPYPCFIERSEAHQPGLRLQRSCEDWRSNLPCIYQTESGIWGLHFNQKHASYVTSSQCSPELFHTNCLEGSQGTVDAATLQIEQAAWGMRISSLLSRE
ncbi:peptide chain release factor PrfB2, chloroplastic isoform X2 [Lolium perenne]|uniref:peptide chain release factor PrfB2, chloroplastic isoform X2 n=1 Tax=Lolium perenne TaxID=4522 RepID=UPI003A99EB46